jgi:hypothetical protein
MKRIILLVGPCLAVAMLGACSSNSSGRVAGDGAVGNSGESAGIGRESDLLSEAPAPDPAAGSAAGAILVGARSHPPVSGGSDWH